MLKAMKTYSNSELLQTCRVINALLSKDRKADMYLGQISDYTKTTLLSVITQQLKK